MINFIAQFGVGGFPPAWYETDYRRAQHGKHREGIFPWLQEIGLNWLELECTHGVKMPMDQARSYADRAKYYGIGLSIHAPYYCVLSSKNRETVMRSKQDLRACFDLANVLGATRIIFHPGYPGYDRETSLKLIIDAMIELEQFRPADVHLYPEIGGKVKQLGSLEEIIRICEAVESAAPCLDIAHLHARTNGSITTVDAVLDVMDEVGNRLGVDKLMETHYHVYPISYNANGELHHLSDGTDIDSPPLEELFSEAIIARGIIPTVISEATNSQEKGAQRLKHMYYGEIVANALHLK